MANRYRIHLLTAGIILFALLMAGCSNDPNLQIIQGSWFYEDPHLKVVEGQPHWIERWIFDRGSFANSGCCFGEVNITGSYRILESDENLLLLELYNMQGTQGTMVIDRDTVTTMQVKIDPETDTLIIGRTGPYSRVSP